MVARILVLVALLASAVAGAGSVAARGALQGEADLPATAALTPEDAFFYVSLSLDRDSAQWQLTEELLARVGVPDALEQLELGLIEDAGLGTPTADDGLDALFGGEVAFVLSELPEDAAAAITAGATGQDAALASPVASPEAGAEQGFAAVLLPGEPDEAFAIVEREVERGAEEQGDVVEETTYEGIEMRSVTRSDDVSGDATAFARVDEAILLAPTAADLEPIIDVAIGDAPSLEESGRAARVRAELNPDLLSFGFVNYERLVESIGPEAFAQAQALFPTGTPVALDEAAAVDAGFGVWADEPGFRLDAVALAAPGETLPVQAGVQNLDVTSDERVPADSLFFQAGPGQALGLGLLGAVSPLLQTFSLTEGIAAGTPVADVAATPATSPEEIEAQLDELERTLGFDPRADLLERFAGEYALAFTLNPLGLATGTGINGVLATDLVDAGTVALTAQKIARLLEQQADVPDVATRQVEGATVYVVADPEAESSGVPAVEFGVVGEELVIGLGNGLDEWVEGSGDALADDERYRRVLATLPDDYFQVTYLNIGQIVPLIELAQSAAEEETTEDADPDCANFGSQSEAQAAFDAGDEASFNLDQDFDGEACEDFFGAGSATPEASPVASPAATGDLSSLEAFASVFSADEERQTVNAILYIGES